MWLSEFTGTTMAFHTGTKKTVAAAQPTFLLTRGWSQITATTSSSSSNTLHLWSIYRAFV